MAMKTTLFAALLFASPVFGSIYWNNGGPDLQTSLLNGVGLPSAGNALVYDDFVIGPGGATVTGVFSNDTLGGITNLAEIATAFWEIRSGVSDGNGGTVVGSGTGAANVASAGVSMAGTPIYTVGVSGLNVNLAPGTYWLAVAPDVSTAGVVSDIVTTDGTGGAGNPQGQNGNSFVDSTLLAANFETTSDFLPGGDPLDGGNLDFSEGVVTGNATATPEPGTALLGLGAMAALFAGRKLRTLAR